MSKSSMKIRFEGDSHQIDAMRANKIRSLPKSGEGTVISGIGFDGF